jgi:hypothetical protein
VQKSNKIKKMYKDKQIKFKQVSEQKVEILLEYEDFNIDGKSGFTKKEKVIGHIFTEDYTNAIQVCGFSEAFDYWGCGLFGKPKYIKKSGERVGNSHTKMERMPIYKRDNVRWMEQVRDIQLYFDEETVKCGVDTLDDCMRCYNSPCVCDVARKTNVMEKDDNGTDSPFLVKRAHEIHELENKSEREARKEKRKLDKQT